MYQKTFKPLTMIIAVFAALALLLGLSGTTNAYAAATENNLNAATVIQTQSSLKSGQHVFLSTVNGYNIYAQKDAEGKASLLASPENSPLSNLQTDSYGVCPITVASIIAGLGASVLALAAATGGLEVAGFFLAPEVLNIFVAALGSYSELEALAAQYVC